MAVNAPSGGQTGSRFLPRRLAIFLEERPELRGALINMQWLFLQSLVDAMLGIAVGVWVARHLEPAEYGVLSYATALVALASPLGTLGLGVVVVRDLVSKPDAARAVLGSTLLLRTYGSVGLFVLSMGAVLVSQPNDHRMWLIVGLVGVGQAVRNLGVYELWFQAKVQAKYATIARSASGVLTSAMRIAMIVAGAGVTWFAGAYALELVFDTLFMAFLYRLTTRVRLSEWRAQAPLMRELLAFSWPLIFSGLMASIYLKIDQVMIGQMLDDRAVGYYAAAVRLSETFYMMSSVALTSVFPSLVRARQIDFKLYLSRIQRLYDLFVWFAIGLGTVMQVAAVPVVTLLYGRAFLPGAQALAIHVWSGLFWFSGSVGHRYLVTENHARTALWMTVAGAVVNVVLNVFMIPAWGISGAALATLLSFAVSHCLAGLAFPPARIFVQFFLRALNPFGVVARLRAGDVRAG